MKQPGVSQSIGDKTSTIGVSHTKISLQAGLTRVGSFYSMVIHIANISDLIALPHYSPTKSGARMIDRETPYLK
jgi:hypothetical protein